jgi:hypothetical protein
MKRGDVVGFEHLLESLGHLLHEQKHLIGEVVWGERLRGRDLSIRSALFSHTLKIAACRIPSDGEFTSNLK